MTKNMASGPDSKWYLSGVGQQDIQVPRIPPPGYDIRDVLKGRRPEASQYKVRYMMNAIESEEWKSFEHTYRWAS